MNLINNLVHLLTKEKSPQINDEKKENPRKSNFLQLIKNPSMVFFIQYLPFFSFPLANYFILKVFDHFLVLNRISYYSIDTSWTFWIYYVVGLILSLIIIKTNFALRFKQFFLEFWNFFTSSYNILKTFIVDRKMRLPYWSLPNVLLMAVRNLFFNILNDLFILTIFWTAFFFLLFFIGLFTLPVSFNFQNFAEALALIGILSGFFQFYTSSYREDFRQLFASIVKEQLQIIQEVSMEDFLSFLERTHQQSLLGKIRSSIFKDDIFKGMIHLKGARDSSITIYSAPPLGWNNALYLFQYLDSCSIMSPEIITRDDLHKQYESYFSEKLKKFKENIENSEIEETRRLITSTIVYSDEVLTSLTKATIEFPDEDIEPEFFVEYYHKFTYDCMYYYLDVLMDIPSIDEVDVQTKIIE